MGPYGTIGQWSWLLGKTRPGPKAKHLKRHTRKRKWAVAPKRPGGCATLCPSYTLSVCVGFLVVCCLWEAPEMGPGEQKWASESIIYIFLLWSVGEYGQCSRFFWVHVHLDGRYRPSTDFFWHEGTSTVDIDQFYFWYESISTIDFDRFLAQIDGRCDIDRIFK